MLKKIMVLTFLLSSPLAISAESINDEGSAVDIITGGLEGLKSNLPVPTNLNTKTATIAASLGLVGFVGYNFANQISALPVLGKALQYICLGQVLPEDLLRSLSILLAFSGGCTVYETGPELRKQLVSSIFTAIMWEQFNNPNQAKENECLKIVLKAISSVGAIQVLMQHSSIVAEFFERVRMKQRAFRLRNERV